ncbi:Esterase FE4 [Frankliniella fusca]|uniref:Carboxylic ester hydrolase n=1 Tax=Frankliniella fusca TaxID=407009 RepID=A0AAE1HN83_9NEOP|nr:Esterase FE4 [Frankliniella fusca]
MPTMQLVVAPATATATPPTPDMTPDPRRDFVTSAASSDRRVGVDGDHGDEDATMPKAPVVQTLAGAVRGRLQRTRRGQGTAYFSFRGVPYAAPPVGDLRFKRRRPPAPQAPLPVEPWTGVRDASAPGRPCLQPFGFVPIGPREWNRREVVSFIKTVPELVRVGLQLYNASEDCLYANVFTPQLPGALRNKPKLPVMVFIHGGGFRLGDGDFLYGPDYLMDAGGIVLVTFNYRIGPFGFLATGTEEAPGNAGLKDQVQLLRWVRDNIAAFGGDPDQVTLTGESAGGVSVHLHTLSPLSRGLFHRAIASSGAAGCEWANEDAPLEHARQLAKHLGVEDPDPDALVRRLRALPAAAINRAFQRHMHSAFTPRLSLGMYFVPSVEPPLPGAFLAEDPLRALADGKQAHVPLITGHNDREGLLIFLGVGDGKMGPKSRARRRAFMEDCARQRPEAFLPVDLYRGLDAADRDAVGREVLRYYFGVDELGPDPDKFDQFIDLFGDTMFSIPVLRGSRLHAARSTAPVYHYHFTHDGEMGTIKNLFRAFKYQGASHGDDLGYVFYSASLAACRRRPDPRDEQCRRNLLGVWTSFVRTGEPTAGCDGDSALGVAWPPRSAQQLHFLEISEMLCVKTGAPNSRQLFWNDVYKKYLGVSLL